MATKSTLTFCEDYVKAAGDIADLAYWFIGAALLIGILHGFVEIVKKYRTPPNAPRVQQAALKDLIDALKGLIEALASAPAWIALFAFGLVLFFAVGTSIPTKCEAEMNQPYASAATDAETEPKAPGPDSNASRDGDGAPPREGSGIEK